MFNDDSIISNLYNKINEITVMTSKECNRRKKIYAMSIVFFFLAFSLFKYFLYLNPRLDNNLRYVLLNNFILIPFFSSLSGYFHMKAENMEWEFLLSYGKFAKQLKQKEKELEQYIAEENTQREIITFKKFDALNKEAMFELKKALALKEYKKARILFTQYLKIINIPNITKTEITEKEKIEKLVHDYELNLKMKL